MEPLNYAAVIGAGRDLVPNLLEQQIRQSLAGAQVQQAQTQAAQETRLTASGEAAAQREAQYQQAVRAFADDPSVGGYSQIVTAFPEHHEAVTQAWRGVDERNRRADRQQMAEIFAALANGSPELAARTLERRIDADREAGGRPGEMQGADPADLEIQRLITSGDPANLRRARGMLAFALASGDGGMENFAATLNAIAPPEAEQYAQSLNLTPGSPEYLRAVQDFVLRGEGPTARQHDERMEGVRHGYRVDEEGVRHGYRLDESQFGHSLDEAEIRLRSEIAPEARPTEGSVIGRIMDKIARGVGLTPGEQRVWTDYQTRHPGPGNGRGRGRGRGRGTSPAAARTPPAPPRPAPGGNGAIIRNPRTGQRMQLRGGQWVPIR